MTTPAEQNPRATAASDVSPGLSGEAEADISGVTLTREDDSQDDDLPSDPDNA